MKRTKKLTALSILTAASLCVFVLEAQLPPLVPVPGVKLGLSNIFTLFAYDMLGASAALALLVIRICLGSVITGHISALGYSLCGGLLSYIVLRLLHRKFPAGQFWVLSILCAIGHNLGQILLAVFIMGSHMILWYFPALILSALITGAFTGLSCQLVLRRLKENRLFERNTQNRR